MGLPLPSFVDFSNKTPVKTRQDASFPSSRCSSARPESSRHARSACKVGFPSDASDWGLISSLRDEIALKDALIHKLRDEVRRLTESGSCHRISQLMPESGLIHKRKCSSGDISSDSNEGAESGACSRFRSPSRLTRMRDRLKDARKHHIAPTPRVIAIPLVRPVKKYADEIDAVVHEYLGDQEEVGRLKRVSYGVYSLGAKRIGICVKNGKPLVRIGGGASVNLETYLDTH